MRLARRPRPRPLLTLCASVLLLPGPAGADHPGALHAAPMSPVTVALLAGGLALVVGLLVVALVMLLPRREPRP